MALVASGPEGRHEARIVAALQDGGNGLAIGSGELEREVDAEGVELEQVQIGVFDVARHFREQLVGHRERLVALDDDRLDDVNEVEIAEVSLHFLDELLVGHGDGHEVIVFCQLVPSPEAAGSFEHVLVIDGDGHRPHSQLDVLALLDVEPHVLSPSLLDLAAQPFG